MNNLSLPVYSAKVQRHCKAVQNNPAQFVAREKYSWPGGYWLAGVTDDGGLLCPECIKDNYRLIRTSYPSDGWHVIGYMCGADVDPEPDLHRCDHCSKEL